MLKKASAPLFVVLFIASGLLWAQDAPDGVVATTNARYVQISTGPAKMGKAGTFIPAGDSDSCSTGFRIGGSYVLTNAHTTSLSDVYDVDGKLIDILHNVSPPADLMLVELPSATPVPWIRIADPKVGQMVWATTNSDCKGPFFFRGMVSRVDGAHLYMQEDTIPGGSGSGFVNAKGELIGFASGNFWVDNGPGRVGYTGGISAMALRVFLSKVLPPEDLVKMGITPDAVKENEKNLVKMSTAPDADKLYEAIAKK